jgi:hypothetical protein
VKGAKYGRQAELHLAIEQEQPEQGAERVAQGFSASSRVELLQGRQQRAQRRVTRPVRSAQGQVTTLAGREPPLPPGTNTLYGP